MKNNATIKSVQVSRQRLAAYSTQAMILLLGNTIDAQIVYTDVDPDFGVFDQYQNSDVFFPVDFNSDGITDLSFYFSRYFNSNGFSSYYTFKLKVVDFYRVAGSSSWLNSPFVFDIGDTIDNELPWIQIGEPLVGRIDADRSYSYWGTDHWGFNLMGNFAGEDGKYMGVKFLEGTDVHYGWIRLSVKNNYHNTAYSNGINYLQAYIEDFAYNTVPDQPIIISADHGVAPATNVKLSDIYDTGISSDYEVSFDIPANESYIGKYRIYIAPYVPDLSLNISFINSCPYFIEVAPNGMNQSFFLPAEQKDVYGEKIHIANQYCAYVLSVGTAMSGFYNALSTPSFTEYFNNSDACVFGSELQTDTLAANGDPSDYQITFEASPYELGILEYRIFLIPDEEFESQYILYDLEDILDQSAYQTVQPDNSSEYSVRLQADLNDWNGDPVKDGKYVCIILGKSDTAYNSRNCISKNTNIVINKIVKPVNIPVESVPIFYLSGNTLFYEYTANSPDDAMSLKVYNVLGELTFSDATTTSKFSLNIADYQPGFYIAVLYANGVGYSFFFNKL